MKPVWIVDSEGDFGFQVEDKTFVFYKWHDATSLESKEGVTQLSDDNSKALWRKIKKAVEEWKEEEGL